MATFRLVGDSWGLAFALMCGGIVSRQTGDIEEAMSMLAESEALFRKIWDRQLIAWVLLQRGKTLLGQNRPDDARTCLAESLELEAAELPRLWQRGCGMTLQEAIKYASTDHALDPLD